MRATLNCTIENSIIVRDVTKRKALNQLKIPPSPVWALEVVVQRQKGGTPKKRVLALWHTKKRDTFCIFQILSWYSHPDVCLAFSTNIPEELQTGFTYWKSNNNSKISCQSQFILSFFQASYSQPFLSFGWYLDYRLLFFLLIALSA